MVCRLGILRRRDLEEAFGEGLLRRRARRQHREIFRIVEFAVGIEREQADEGLVLLHDDRNGRRHHVGRIGADDEVDFVDVEQLGVDARHRRRIGLIVVIDQLHRPAEQAALGVDFLFPDLGAEQRLLAVGGERAGQRHAEADLDRVLGLRRRRQRRRGEARRKQYGAEGAGNAAAGYSSSHGVPPEVVSWFMMPIGSGPEAAVSATGEAGNSVRLLCIPPRHLDALAASRGS